MTTAAVDYSSFGMLLRRLRRDRLLTQEALAESAGISVETISALERGVSRAPYQGTLIALGDALALEGEDRDRFLAAGRKRSALPADAAVRHPTNLPDELTPFIGREFETAQVARLVRAPSVRLLTLTGPGGSGKTRLGLHVGRTLLQDFQDGVFFVSLAPLTDATLVPAAVAQVLAVREVRGEDLLQTLSRSVRDKRILLILDNYEHLLDAASVVATLLEVCRELCVLVTSRAPLHLLREHEYPVNPLAVPRAGRAADPEQISRYDAVALFLERGRAMEPDFCLTHETAPVIAEICRRLDGLPLAIELAAARLRVLPPHALLERLSRRLDLLADRTRDRPDRHRTLAAAIDWSYHLLSEEERLLFARLSVFAGGCTLEAAEAVCNPDGALDLLEGMTGLVEKNMVRHAGEDEPRFSMLETIREYARERLVECGEEDLSHAAHARFFARLAEDAEHTLRGPEQTEWLARLDREAENLRAALEWSLHCESALAIRLAGSLGLFWRIRGYITEGRSRLEAALRAQPAAEQDIALRSKALHAAAYLAQLQDDLTGARDMQEESARLYRVLGDKVGLARSLNHLATVLDLQGNFTQARELFEESLGLFQEAEVRTGILSVLANLGVMATELDRWEEAETLLEESVQLGREIGDKTAWVNAINHLGVVMQRQGRWDRAQELYEESLRLRRELGDRYGMAYPLLGLAAVAEFRQEHERATRLLSAAISTWTAVNGVPDQSVRWILEDVSHAVQAILDADSYERAAEQGRAMSLEQAVAYALGERGQGRASMP